MTDSPDTNTAYQKAIKTIQENGGTIRTKDAIQKGVHPRTLYHLRDSGEIEFLSRGLYRLRDLEQLSDPDLVIVAKRAPQATICLTSALAYHEITTQIPHAVSIALPKGSKTPRLDYPPLKAYRFSDAALIAGVEIHHIDNVAVRIFSPEKTLADCFKFRNKLGMDIVLEALKLYKTRKNFDLENLMKYAGVCRVENVMRPYLEAML